MSLETIQEILKHVEKPSRYIGTEINTIKKENDIKLKIALAFPDLYDIGTSHFGIQILYHILNQRNDTAAERVFTPAPDMEKKLRESNVPIFTLESQQPLNTFDIIGFSLLYELNYTNLLTILDLADIPFLSSERNENHPLIIAGGPALYNPEPVAELFDVIVIGDGEKIINKISDFYLLYGNNKSVLLKKLSELEGIYIPSFFDVSFKKINGHSFQELIPKIKHYSTITKTIVSNLENAEVPEKPVIPFGKPIHDRLRLEISRGCSRGCRFCQAGMIYRPVRERKLDTLINITKNTVCNTGYDDVSLLSLSTSDYENLNSLMKQIMDLKIDNGNNLSISLPSVRAGKLNSTLMETIKQIKKTGFTIAPEAGTQRLRDVINKGITEEEIINTVENAFLLGWKNIKLYFMIGLPTETKEDLQGIVDLVLMLRKMKYNKGKKPNINVSISTFVPKPHTPFQWEKQISEEESWEKIIWLKEKFYKTGITFKWGKTDISFLEGIISRGDRRITPLIINAYNKGCRLDGWSEYFDINLWKEAIKDEKIDVSFYTQRKRTIEEPLPWDIVNTGINKKFLIDEKDKASNKLLTADCRFGKCHQCGICDFKNTKPYIEKKHEEYQLKLNKDDNNLISYKKIKINYNKIGKAKYFGHLELVNIFTKCLTMINLPLKYSNGFNPKLKIVFNNPLPLGYESNDEFFIIQIDNNFELSKIKNKLNSILPEGLSIIKTELVNNKLQTIEKENNRYLLQLKNINLDSIEIDHFNNSKNVIFEKVNKKGKINILNLKDFVKSIEIKDNSTILIDIKKVNSITVRPEVVVSKIFKIDDKTLKNANITKIENF